MALVACGECGREISDQAATCPHCGVPITATTVPGSFDGKFQHRSQDGVASRKPLSFGFGSLILAAIVVVSFIWHFQDSSTQPESQSLPPVSTSTKSIHDDLSGWRISQKHDTLNDRVSLMASSVQTENGVSANVTVECEPNSSGNEIDAFVVIRDLGLLSSITDVRNGHVVLRGKLRVNENEILEAEFTNPRSASEFLVANLLMGDGGEKLVAGREQLRTQANNPIFLGMLGALGVPGSGSTWQQPLKTTQRIMVQFATSGGPLTVKIPTSDPSIQKVIEGCGGKAQAIPTDKKPNAPSVQTVTSAEAPTEQTDKCPGVLKTHGFLSRAHLQCGFENYSEPLIDAADSCINDLGGQAAEKLLEAGLQAFDDRETERGHESLCKDVQDKFPAAFN